MRRVVVPSLVLMSLPALAAAQTPSPCPFAPADLTTRLGVTFTAGKPESGILGKGCRYDAGAITLWVDAGPNPAPTAEQYRKMSNPPRTAWTPVPNDADKAVHSTPPSDVSPFPNLSYERKGWLVNLRVTGVSGKATIDTWNSRLVALPRLP